MLTSLLQRLRMRLRRDRLDDELADEIRMHIELRTQSLIDRGVDPDNAAYEARRQFGNVTLKREETREAWSLRIVDSLFQDLKYGARLMRRSPIFTAVAVASIGVGIGASAAVFSLADAVLFKKLPVHAPDQLAIFRWSSGPKPPAESLTGNMISNAEGFASTSFSPPAFEELRRSASATMDLFAFGNLWGGVNVAVNGRADVVSGQVVSGNYFAVLGLTPAAGRLIVESDDRAGAAPVAVISHAFWQRQFALAPGAVGMPMTVNGIAFTIVGVTPRGFHGTLETGDSPAITLPIATRTTIEHGNDWRSAQLWWLLLMGRFNKGRMPAEALPELDGTFKQVTAAANASLASSELPRLELLPGARGQVDAGASRRETLTIMAWVAGVLLLVASANVASLLLVRGAARGREITMRLAIGASRSRVIRQFVTEAVLIGSCGCAIGLLLAQGIATSLVAALGAGGAEVLDLSVSWRVLAFASVLGCLCSTLFGVAPAIRATRAHPANGMLAHADNRNALGSPRRTRFVSGLVVTQVALSVMLASLGGLLSYSVWSLQRVKPGFDASNLLIFTVYPSRNGYEPARIRSLYESAVARLEALPGVRSVTFSASSLIGSGGSTTAAVKMDTPVVARNSEEQRRVERANVAWRHVVGDRFFETMGMPVLQGRTFQSTDLPDSPPVAVINRSLALRLFNEVEVVGRHYKNSAAAGATVFEIIGVVGDAKYAHLRRDAPPTFYASYRQGRMSQATFEVKTAGDPLQVAPLVIDAMKLVDPNLPLASIRTQQDQINRSMERERLMARLATALAGVSALLSAIGLYALLSYVVGQRVPEIGVRMALGAERRTVRWMFLRRAAIIAACGVVAGLGAAVATTGLAASLLFELSPTNPVILGTAAGLTFVVTIVALRAE